MKYEVRGHALLMGNGLYQYSQPWAVVLTEQDNTSTIHVRSSSLPPESVTLPDSPTFHTFDASTNPAYILIFFAGSWVPWAQICHSHRSLLHETVVESGMEMQVIELLYTYIKIWPCRFISIFHQIRKQFVTSRISISSLVIGMAWKPAAVLHLQSSNDMVRSSAQKERKEKWELTLMLLPKTCLLLDSKPCLVDHGPCPVAQIKLGVDRWPTHSLANSRIVIELFVTTSKYNSTVLFCIISTACC